MQTKQTVLILYPQPSEHYAAMGCVESEVGVMDQVDAVVAALDHYKIACRSAAVGSLGELTRILAQASETIVFNFVETIEGSAHKAAYVPALCEAFGKAYTGNSTAALLLSTDKWHTKAILAAAGLPIAQGLLVEPGQKAKPDFDGPYFVKPAATDASEGIDDASIVKTKGAALDKAVARIHTQFKQTALVERYIEGRELNITVLYKDNQPMVMPLAEIDFSAFSADKPRIVSYDAKWKPDSFEYNNTPRIIPAPVPVKVAQKIRDLAQRACAVLSCMDYCRVDFRLDEKLNPYILEVNANPDISPQAGLAAAITAAEMKYHAFVKLCLDNAVARENKSKFKNQKSKIQLKTRKQGDLRNMIRFSETKDIQPVLALLDATKFFRQEEMLIADEVVTDAAKKGQTGHYQSYVLEVDGSVVGWVCWGPTPCTVGSYDIYWLGVDPACQGKGYGRKLMDFAEEQIRSAGGRLYIVETSGRESYLPTRAFYEKIGYTLSACVKDFYATGDDKIIYTKNALLSKKG
jgi:D-alanine-D-alanine ligase